MPMTEDAGPSCSRHRPVRLKVPTGHGVLLGTKTPLLSLSYNSVFPIVNSKLGESVKTDPTLDSNDVM